MSECESLSMHDSGLGWLCQLHAVQDALDTVMLP